MYNQRSFHMYTRPRNYRYCAYETLNGNYAIHAAFGYVKRKLVIKNANK